MARGDNDLGIWCHSSGATSSRRQSQLSKMAREWLPSLLQRQSMTSEYQGQTLEELIIREENPGQYCLRG